jgi:serine/threonine protein kinase
MQVNTVTRIRTITTMTVQENPVKQFPSPRPITTINAIHPQMVMNKLKPIKDDFLSFLGSRNSISRLALCVNDSASGKSFAECYDMDMDEVLGEGGYAFVYRCKHKLNGKTYAVKEVFETHYASAGENIKEEIDALKRLKEGPYVVMLLDVFREIDRTYMVMEELAGGDLLEKLEEKEVFGEQQARRISRTLLEAIGFCHKKFIAHRDIKPENILLVSAESETHIKLADFGCARKITGAMYTMCGSPQYVAPEIYTHNGCGYDERCDLWSAAVVIYAILGGYAPFEAPSSELSKVICTGHFEFHTKYWSEVSQPPKDLISSLFKVNPNDRATLEQALDSSWLRRRDKEIMEKFQDDKFDAWRKLQNESAAGLRRRDKEQIIEKFAQDDKFDAWHKLQHESVTSATTCEDSLNSLTI